MKDKDLVNAIRRLKVETRSLACIGCGHGHNCGVSGCAIMREAADRIPVEERLPEDRSDVLVVAYWHERWGAYMGWGAPERAAWSVHVGIGDRSDIAVTHWMPLPEPPEEER